MTHEVTPTEVKVAEMLVENTGAALMDSGGAYGRQWQTTRLKYGLDSPPNSSYSGFPLRAPEDPSEDEMTRVAHAMFEEPQGRIDSYGCGYVSTFHWLIDRLEYDPEEDAKYQRFTRMVNLGKDRYDSSWGLEVMDRFAELMEKRGAGGGIYPGDGGSITTINTYNGDCELDRTLQFMTFHGDGRLFDDDEPFVILQVHGGADVRGGYTDPVLFRVAGYEGIADLYDFDRATYSCEGGPLILPENPDKPVVGQLDIEGNEYTPPVPPEVSHWWDNSYGDGIARHEHPEPPYKETALVFPSWYKDEAELAKEIEELKREGVRSMEADIAAWNEDKEVWLCPYDLTPIGIYPNIVG